MKIILFFAPSFWYTPYEKTLAEAPDVQDEECVENAVVVFYHAEAEDAQSDERRNKVLTKLVKNIKWLAGKFETRTVVLHSFGHLSSSKAPADFTRALIDDARERLERTEFRVHETPFGYVNEWKLHVAGPSLAKVFKDL